jgi:hypothetical protein
MRIVVAGVSALGADPPMTHAEKSLILRAFGARVYPPTPEETALCVDLTARGYLARIQEPHQTAPAYHVARLGTEFVYRYMGYTR